MNAAAFAAFVISAAECDSVPDCLKRSVNLCNVRQGEVAADARVAEELAAAAK
jgi:hypothetical protein